MKKKEALPIGVLVRINDDPFKIFEKVKGAGFSYCQMVSPPDEYMFGKDAKSATRKLKDAMKKNGVGVNSVFMSFKNQDWTYPDGAMKTLGLVPSETRAERIARACMIANWANDMGVDTLAAHVGFVPEDRNCELYKKFIDGMRGLAQFLDATGQRFTFETGQESVEVLKNTIKDIGMDNVGINFDPANLLLYDMDHPSVLVEKLGKYVMHMHCKDGARPVKKMTLGEEKLLGEGDTNFEKLLRDLFAAGYRGPLTIEREISGAQQDKDIQHAKAMLERIKNDLLK